MNIKKLAIVAMLGLAPLGSATAADGLSYSYLQGQYISGEADDGGVSDGFGVRGSAKVADAVYIVAGYTSAESDDLDPGPGTATVEGRQIDAGLGFRAPLGQGGPDFNAEVRYIYVEAEFTGTFAAFGEGDDSGYGLRGALRHLFTPMFELEGGVNYVDVGEEDDTSLDIQGLVHFSPAFAALAGWATSDDADAWTVGGRFNFGR